MVDGEEVDYDSDPEDALHPSMMRRREASDDEDGEGSGAEREIKPIRKGRLGIRSDDELEGEGDAPGYDEEDYVEQEGEEILEEEVEGEYIEGEYEVEVLQRAVHEVGLSPTAGEFENSSLLREESSLRPGGEMGGNGENNQSEEAVKKESEPYAVPTAGAFYMHDDRFEENGRGRHRRMPGGRRLWESKNDRAWVHDRYEEMNLQDRRYEEKKIFRGSRFRGRGRGRGAGRSFGRGNRSRAYYDDNNNQNRPAKSVKGKGPTRYEPLSNSNEVPQTLSKQHRKTQELTSNNTNSKKFVQVLELPQPEQVAPAKQTFASSLSSASPPFYPSGSSIPDIATVQKPPPLFRGKSVADSARFDRLHLDDSGSQVSGSSQQLSNTNKSPSYKVQGRILNPNSVPNHPASFNQVSRTPLQNQPSVSHQKSFQSQGQSSSLRIVPQQISQHLSISSEDEEAESPRDMTKLSSARVRKARVVNQGAGRGSFLYGGAHTIGPAGAIGLHHGDPNFTGTPTLLPVMQFGGQHRGGIGVPAVGMALPGYVAQPGFGNSEMTWVPVLAGAAGALGASYCSSYIALDGNYYARPSGQISASVSSIKEISGAKPVTAAKPPQKEAVNDEFEQRQNKPRRYSEINFGQ